MSCHYATSSFFRTSVFLVIWFRNSSTWVPPSSRRKAKFVLETLLFLMKTAKTNADFKTHLGFRKKRHEVGKFPPGCHLLSGSCFAFFKHTQMTYTGSVKVAPGKPKTGRGKLKFSPVTGEDKFSLGGGKKSTGSGFTWSVTERCFKAGKDQSGSSEVPFPRVLILNLEAFQGGSWCRFVVCFLANLSPVSLGKVLRSYFQVIASENVALFSAVHVGCQCFGKIVSAYFKVVSLVRACQQNPFQGPNKLAWEK